jgi:hypothetical protein
LGSVESGEAVESNSDLDVETQNLGAVDDMEMENTIELGGSTSDLSASSPEDDEIIQDEDQAYLPSDDDLDFPEISSAEDNIEEGAEELTMKDSIGGDNVSDASSSFEESVPESQIEIEKSESKSDIQKEFDYKTSMQKLPTNIDDTMVGENIASPTKTYSSSQHENEHQATEAHSKILSDDIEKIFHQFEMMKAQKEHIQKELEQDRESLRKAESEIINLRDLSEELKVENKILKKRFDRKDDDYRKQYELSEEKRKVIEGKYRLTRQKLEESEAKNRAKNSSNRSVEKNLESKIELMEVDFRSQMGAREEKISDLRRSNEALEFNLESLVVKNQELLERKKEIEERLSLVISSLRGSIDLIEEDQSALLEEIKRNEELDG